MNALLHKSRYFESAAIRVVIGLIAVSAICVLSLSPALADRDGGYGGGYRDGGYRGGDRDHQEWHGNRGDYDNRGYRPGYGGYRPVYPQPYGYAQPVRVPPPVYYPPQPSPGITLVLPLNLGR